MTTAVLLLAYGGPESLADIPAYLLDVRGGRETPPSLIAEITHRYAAIGGRSPLLDITRRTAAKLAQALGMPVYVGMRHWSPWMRDTVTQMAADGVRRAVVICMAPHYSRMSIGAYRRRLDEALAHVSQPFAVHFIASWHLHPDFIAALTANVEATLTRWPVEERRRVFLVFTAHSLPAFLLEQGDPYDRQLRETATAVARQLAWPDGRWLFCYQSAAQTGVPWLGPAVEDVVVALAQGGEKDLIVAPIGFVADHVEVLYDIDIAVQALARQHGARVERPPMLNDGPAMLRILTSLVQQALTAPIPSPDALAAQPS